VDGAVSASRPAVDVGGQWQRPLGRLGSLCQTLAEVRGSAGSECLALHRMAAGCLDTPRFSPLNDVGHEQARIARPRFYGGVRLSALRERLTGPIGVLRRTLVVVEL